MQKTKVTLLVRRKMKSNKIESAWINFFYKKLINFVGAAKKEYVSIFL